VGPIFLCGYGWISGVTVLVFGWCFFNQRISSVPGSTIILRGSDRQGGNNNSGDEWTQTGYKPHIIGCTIYSCVILTLLGIQFLLFTLTILFYVQAGAISRWETVFHDEPQALKAFQITWMVGFPWTLVMQYPSSIYTLFLRRCYVKDATYVCIVAPTKSTQLTNLSKVGSRVAHALWFPFDVCLAFVFSLPRINSEQEAIFCRVSVDQHDTSRSIYHRTRRYVLDMDLGEFVIGYIGIGTIMSHFVDQYDGLTSDEAESRMSVVGPNTILMEEPSLLRSICREFRKPFYVYQNFMVWTWAPYFYYYMALVNTFVRVGGGILAAWFQYTSELSLYKHANMDGDVTYVDV
jgi:hypothetical protein